MPNQISIFFHTIAAASLLVFLVWPAQANEADDFRGWLNLNKSLVDSGSMKRSDFYTQMYDRVASLKAIEDKSNMLSATSMLIKASQELESGNITMQEFNNRKRDAMAVWSKPGVSTAIQPAPSTPINLFGDQINCTSTSMGSTTNTKCW